MTMMMIMIMMMRATPCFKHNTATALNSGDKS
jgi:hypothetical protein